VAASWEVAVNMPNCCQGVPNGPCPRECCDESVKFTVYDLFLCPQCERSRDESSVTAVKSTKVIRKGRSAKDVTTALSKAELQPGHGCDIAAGSLNNSGNQMPHSATVCDDDDDSGNDEDACPRCLMQADSSKRCVKCDICLHRYHQKCTAISAKIFDKFIVNVNVTGWVCDACKDAMRSSYKRLETAIAHIAAELAIVQSELVEIKSKSRPDTITAELTAIKAELNELQSTRQPETIVTNAERTAASPINSGNQTVMIVQRTLNDSARRKRNIIVSGLPETQADDRSEFMKFCESNLPIKPLVAENSCVRIGTKLPNKPRRLLVRLGSEEVASSMLRSAPLLRKSTDAYISQNVYINPDLSPAAAKLAFEARKLRRTSRLQRNFASGVNCANGASSLGLQRLSDTEQRTASSEAGSEEPASPATHADDASGTTNQATKTSSQAESCPNVNQRAHPSTSDSAINPSFH
jgi:hypothetical protein